MKTVIVDDEMHCIESLTSMLEKYTSVKVLQTFESPLEAVKKLPELQFDILFIDIEMPHLNGFELISLFPLSEWQVIFTTAYDEYAIKAFKVNAIDYLLKPIAKDDLLKSIEKCETSTGISEISSRANMQSHFRDRLKKIAIPTLGGLDMLSIDSITYLESDGNYSKVKVKSGTEILVSKTLKYFDDILSPYGFIRIHNSYLINPNNIQRYVRGDGGYVVMDNGSMLNVSRSRKELLIRTLQGG